MTKHSQISDCNNDEHQSISMYLDIKDNYIFEAIQINKCSQ